MTEPTAAPYIHKDWEGFAFTKVGGTIFYAPYLTFETRNESTFKLIQEAVVQSQLPDFDWIVVNTSDRDDFPWLLESTSAHATVKAQDGRKLPFVSYCHSGLDDVFSAPDFVYDHWRQTNLDDFEEARLTLASIQEPAQTQHLGWRGAPTHPNRNNLVALDDKQFFDVEFIHWDRSNPNRLHAPNFVSFEDQIKQWRYLIDIEGNGYSGRLKLLLHAPRLVFIQDRQYKEDFFRYIRPWEHFVPVKNNFSDLRMNLDYIRQNPALEARIIKNANSFAGRHLTRAAAVGRWANLIKRLRMGQSPENSFQEF
jgi:hypothetical protein